MLFTSVTLTISGVAKAVEETPIWLLPETNAIVVGGPLVVHARDDRGEVRVSWEGPLSLAQTN